MNALAWFWFLLVGSEELIWTMDDRKFNQLEYGARDQFSEALRSDPWQYLRNLLAILFSMLRYCWTDHFEIFLRMEGFLSEVQKVIRQGSIRQDFYHGHFIWSFQGRDTLVYHNKLAFYYRHQSNWTIQNLLAWQCHRHQARYSLA